MGIGSLVLENQRSLTMREILVGMQVFMETIPYNKVYIGDGLGFKDCPFTEYVSPVHLFGTGYYVLHMGKVGYNNLIGDETMPHDGDPARYTFIHELTHVWQGHHSVFNTVLAESFYHQLVSENAYDYEAGKEWNEYNVEQQAKIVEHWYVKGMKSDDGLYRYIRDHIRNC